MPSWLAYPIFRRRMMPISLRSRCRPCPCFSWPGLTIPLVGRRTLSFQDIAQYPTLALPEDSYPLVEQALRSIGLWSDPVRMQRYRRDLWEGRAETELTIGYGTPLSMEINGGELVRLPLNLPFDSGEAVVVHRDFAADPELQALVQHLQERLHYLARGIPELRLISELP